VLQALHTPERILTESEKALEVIEYLMSKGKNEESFEEAFPYIHHLRKTGSGSLKGYVDHCREHEIVGDTNRNVYLRLLIIKSQVEDLIENDPEFTGVSSIKFQRFAKLAVDEIPF
jgi:hypothetical protein